MKIRRLLALAIPLAALALVSCDPKPYVIDTVNFVDDGNGYVQFSTNDSAMLDTAFLHIPVDGANSFVDSADWALSMDTIKLEGSSLSGFGIVFAYEDTDNYLALLIDMAKRYTVIQRSSGISTTRKAWTSCPDIAGWELPNTIEVEYTHTDVDTGPYFTLKINGTTLTPGTGLYTNRLVKTPAASTKAGFFAGVSSSTNEKFPKYTSDQRFKMTSPFAYP
jgi:hypothetical protein